MFKTLSKKAKDPIKGSILCNQKTFFWIFLSLFSPLSAQPPPDLLSFATGVYDLWRPQFRTWEFEVEYKFHLKCLKPPNRYLQFRPLVGCMATVEGSLYLYAGINFDLLFGNHFHFAPGFAAGYYAQGHGKDLGYPLEFRSGIEVGWQCDDWRRFGLHFYHLSNASLGRINPGEESLVFFYDLPLTKGFPFYGDSSSSK